MKHLVVGAGATLAEACALGIPREECPPLMGDFARKTWAHYNPHPLLEEYLRTLGFNEIEGDPRDLFFELEKEGNANIEVFMEYCWRNRHINFPDLNKKIPDGFISGFRISVPGAVEAPISPGEEFWENLLYHGIGSPIQLFMLQCFFENGTGWKDLHLSKTIAKYLKEGDLVLNLNYDTIFELALEQLGQPFSYAPNTPKSNSVIVCKPHGSLNMVSNDRGFTFGQPDWLGIPQPSGYRSFSGLIPPRLNKSYKKHPISKIIIDSVRTRKPEEIIFWGIGMTESDVDLIDLYRFWSKKSPSITIINPDKNVANKASEILKTSVKHFIDLQSWEMDYI